MAAAKAASVGNVHSDDISVVPDPPAIETATAPLVSAATSTATAVQVSNGKFTVGGGGHVLPQVAAGTSVHLPPNF